MASVSHPGPFGPQTPQPDDYGKRRNSAFIPSSSHGSEPLAEKTRSMSLTPLSVARHSARPKSAKFHPLRLRSNSGLSLHTNEEILKEYTDYNPDGSPRTPLYTLSDSPVAMGSIDAIASGQRRTSVAMTESEVTAKPIASILSQEVFDMCMRNPDTANKLWKFAAVQGRGQDMEYLIKVREYTESLDTLIGQLTAISTAHASIAATQPVRLPPTLSRSLNEGLKYVAASSVPSLETLFTDSKQFVEQRLATECFPAFVKQQLALCTSMALSVDADPENPAAGYTGLGTAFCITDQSAHDHPMVHVSDAHEAVTGYSRGETLAKNCRFLQGPHTDEETVTRMSQAVWRQEESVELVLNYRRDGQPFWNLLYLCPIIDVSGKAPLLLGAQIDVTPCVESPKEMMRLLSYNPGEAARKRERARSLERGERDDYDRDDYLRSSEQSKGSKKSFFNPFKRSSSPPPLPGSRRSFEKLDKGNKADADKPTSPRMPRRGLSTRADTLHTPYDRLFVLQPGSSGTTSPSSLSVDKDWGSSKKSLSTSVLSIAFGSRGGLEVLGLQPASDAVLHKDIFQVLSDYAGSPSMTRHFTSTVRNTVLNQGKPASLELVITRGGPKRPPSSWAAPNAETTKAEARQSERTVTERIMSYWTPLKGADNEIQHVVLVLAPVSLREY
ncbi:Phototropin [Paramyrothecium foliicola]|nr:Phototropin [Paramyrothecium foliicola]